MLRIESTKGVKSWIINPLEPTPADVEDLEGDTPPGPTSMNTGAAKEVDRQQATQIATERGRQDPTHLDMIEDLHSQVASGQVPDVHQDLSTGRVSNEELAKMLKPTDPAQERARKAQLQRALA